MNLIDQREQRRTSTRTGGRITKWKGKVASLAPSLFAVSISSTALMVDGALAQTINTPTTAPVVITTDQDGTVTSTGTIEVDPLNADALVTIDVPDYTSTLLNDGIIFGTNIAGGSRAGIEVRNTLSGQLINNNRIEISTTGTVNDLLRGIQAASIAGVVENNGTILLNLNGGLLGQATGIESSTISGSLINTSNIDVTVDAVTATSVGVEAGIITGDFENSGLISSVATGSSASAFGVETSFLFGSATNSGTITVKATAASEASAYGLRVVNPVFGSLTNSGSITVEAFAGTNPNAIGISMDAIFAGTPFVNSGTISVSATGTGSSASSGYATGISNLNNGGSFSNSGTVEVLIDGVNQANASGIRLNTLSSEGSLSNSGAVVAESYGRTQASAYGLNLENISGSVSNSGTVTALAQGNTALAVGVRGSNSVGASASIQNSGVITARALGQTSVSAFGLDLRDLSGSVSNSGTILARAEGDTVLAMGVRLHNPVAAGASIHNSGTISATASGNRSGLFLLGMEIPSLAGAVDNSGTILVTGNGQTSGRVTGLATFVLEGTGSITNSGTIDVSAHIENGVETYATGIGVGLFQGNLENSGNIRVRSTGVAASSATNVHVYGIAAGQMLGGRLAHSGSITVESAGGPGSNAFGIFAGVFSGTLDVTGDIAVSGAETNYGIFLGSGSGTLNIESTASIDQLIRVADHNVNLTHVGEAAVYRFEDANTAAGEFKTNVTVPNGAWFAQDAGGASPVYAAVSGSDFQLNTLVPFLIGDLNNQLSRQLQNSDRQNRFDRAAYAFNGTPEATSTFSPYVSVTLSQARQDSTADAASADSNLNSLNFGVTRDLGNGTRYGVGLSYAKGTASQSPNSLDTTGGFLSAQIAQDFGFLDLSAGGGAGWFSHTNYRTIGGSADAKGDFTSTVLTGQIGVSRDFGLTDTLILTPEALARLGYQQYGGYTETGSSANATVDGRNVTFSEINVGATVAAKLGPGILTASAAAVYRNVDGPSVVDVSIFGSGASLVSDVARTDTFGELRLGYDQPVGSNGTLSLQGQTGIGQDSMTQAVSAVYKLTF
ncbi:autotransporter outer membrane beta-barrel domain-containing protein [Roseibium sp. SCP14]|uniref:autotransporter outer membrane beta-barrel domain-containing protein n=1 Tax=Roseibium sp. SCP14 TaxID=3141375 RepID=UPI00333B4D4C